MPTQAAPTTPKAVPTIYSMLAALPDDVQPDTSSVRFAVCGAAPASAELLGRFENRFRWVSAAVIDQKLKARPETRHETAVGCDRRSRFRRGRGLGSL